MITFVLERVLKCVFHWSHNISGTAIYRRKSGTQSVHKSGLISDTGISGESPVGQKRSTKLTVIASIRPSKVVYIDLEPEDT
jgi:hypothetical protein